MSFDLTVLPMVKMQMGLEDAPEAPGHVPVHKCPVLDGVMEMTFSLAFSSHAFVHLRGESLVLRLHL